MKNPHALRVTLALLAFAATLPGLASAAITAPSKSKKSDVSSLSKLVEMKPGMPLPSSMSDASGRSSLGVSTPPRVGGVKPSKTALITSLHLSKTK